MRLIIHPNYEDASLWAAYYIADKINAAQGKPFVLGLPTGDSPRGIYKQLIRMYAAKKLSFAQVRTFNMDEYIGLDKNHPQSYHRFMTDNFFITSEGFGLNWAPYQIAPYSAGNIEIVIPWRSIRPLLKHDIMELLEKFGIYMFMV